MQAQIRPFEAVCRKEDVTGVADHLQSTALGSYHRNHCLIRLKQDYSFWNLNNEPTLNRLSIFVHEYFHFIHNFSTVVGLYDFIVQLRLLRLFCNTVGEDGISLGGTVLDSELHAEGQNLLMWRSHLRGSAAPPMMTVLKRAVTHPSFVSFEYVEKCVRLSAQKIKCKSVLVMFDGSALNTNDQNIEILLGSEVLMECCAVEAECMIFNQSGIVTNTVLKGIPVYPYHTARTIFEGIVGLSPSSKFLCSICLLALHSTDPGFAFMELVNACRLNKEQFDEDTLLRCFKKKSDIFLTESIRTILTEKLPLEIAPFIDRGYAGRGLGQMVDWCNTLFEKRLNDSWFEISALDNTSNLESLAELMRSMPVCPVIQEVDALSKIEELIFFSEQEVSQKFIDEIGVAQCLLHFSASHLTTSGEIVETSNKLSRECFFINVCKAPLAIERSSICQKSPWQSFNVSHPQRCWYAHGVGAARALHQKKGEHSL